MHKSFTVKDNVFRGHIFSFIDLIKFCDELALGKLAANGSEWSQGEVKKGDITEEHVT